LFNIFWQPTKARANHTKNTRNNTGQKHKQTPDKKKNEKKNTSKPKKKEKIRLQKYPEKHRKKHVTPVTIHNIYIYVYKHIYTSIGDFPASHIFHFFGI
jgi:hypothetical protein